MVTEVNRHLRPHGMMSLPYERVDLQGCRKSFLGLGSPVCALVWRLREAALTVITGVALSSLAKQQSAESSH